MIGLTKSQTLAKSSLVTYISTNIYKKYLPYRFFFTKNAQERPIEPSFGVLHRLFSILTKP